MFAQKTLQITDDVLATYKNQGMWCNYVCAVQFLFSHGDSTKIILDVVVLSLGGYDLLGRTKDQIRTTEQVNAALKACNDLKLDGLVIIGGENKLGNFYCT